MDFNNTPSWQTPRGRIMIDDEVARIIELKQKMLITRRSRLNHIKIANLMFERLNTIGPCPPHKEAQMKDYKDKIDNQRRLIIAHYDTTQRWCDVKIKAWDQILNNSKDKNMLDKINEAMDEWLQASWAYLGQADIIEESKNAKDEYDMFKIILATVKNKPCRRGGKKHKKK